MKKTIKNILRITNKIINFFFIYAWIWVQLNIHIKYHIKIYCQFIILVKQKNLFVKVVNTIV